MNPLADPERQLALSYAPAAARDALSLLWQLDERMGTIVAATTEPTIGAIRLIWWRDALIRLDDATAKVPAEPLLAAIAATMLPRGISGNALSRIEEGWSALLDEEEPSEASMTIHAEARGAPLFALAGAILGESRSDLADAGAGWALAELGHRLRPADARGFARAEAARRLARLHPGRWKGPLGLLVLFAHLDAALPTATQRRQGAPGRIARALAYRLFGR